MAMSLSLTCYGQSKRGDWTQKRIDLIFGQEYVLGQDGFAHLRPQYRKSYSKYYEITNNKEWVRLRCETSAVLGNGKIYAFYCGYAQIADPNKDTCIIENYPGGRLTGATFDGFFHIVGSKTIETKGGLRTVPIFDYGTPYNPYELQKQMKMTNNITPSTNSTVTTTNK